MRRGGRRGVGRPAGRRGRRGVRMTVRRMTRRRRRRRRRRILLVGGLVTYGVYKMSKSDAQKVEEHTGKPPEELTDEEMEQAMDDLNIEKVPLDESDKQQMEQQGGAYEDEEVEEEVDDASYLDEIERLAQLKDQGIITEAEFEAKKKELLGL